MKTHSIIVLFCILASSGIAFCVITFAGAAAIAGSEKQNATQGHELTQLRLRAEKGDPSAQIDLGKRYESGDGVQRNLATAAGWYEKAAAKGDPIGQCNFGTMLIYGMGCKQDHARARELFEKAANQKCRYGYYELGVVYEQGLGVKADFDKAFLYYKEAALAGVPQAINNIASMKARGQLKGDWTPLEMYEQASKNGDNTAEFNIGMLYLQGDAGVEQNDKLAVDWLSKAAKHGNVEAQCNLGIVLLEGGKGVPADKKTAVFWLNKAAAAGDALAKDALSRLKNKD